MDSEYSLARYTMSQMMMDPDAMASYSMAMLAAQQGVGFVPGQGQQLPMRSSSGQSQSQQQQQQQQQPQQSKYAQLLQVIEEMGKDIRPTYAGSKNAAERLKRGIINARILVRECLMETERSARQ